MDAKEPQLYSDFMKEVDFRAQQMYDALYPCVMKNIPEEYADLMKDNLKKFCAYTVKYDVERNSKESSYIEQTDFYKDLFTDSDAIYNLIFLGKDKHFWNVSNVLSLISGFYDKMEARPFFKRKRIPYDQCVKCFSYILKEANACPDYIKDESLLKVHMIWTYLWRSASLRGYLYCMYIWFKFPKGNMELTPNLKPNYEKKIEKYCKNGAVIDYFPKRRYI